MSLRVAIVGCGKIADAHAAQIRRIPGCDLVGAGDREELMARQRAERVGAERYEHRRHHSARIVSQHGSAHGLEQRRLLGLMPTSGAL